MSRRLSHLALGVLCIAALGACSGGTTGKAGPHCTQYFGEGGCCLMVAGDDAQAAQRCRDTLANEDLSSPQAEQNCLNAINASVAAGRCGTSGTGSTQGGPDAGQSSKPVCTRFLTCASKTRPDTFNSLLEVYGSDGSCWSAPETAATCEDACRTALEADRAAHPLVAECFSCASDAECSAGRPACDPGTRTCVTCVSDDHCAAQPGKVCDAATQRCVQCVDSGDCASGVCAPNNTCVQCVDDSDCSGTKSRCSANVCVQCYANSHCPSNKCNPDGTCCQALTCAANACGSMPNGCGGTLSCGSCSRGTCANNRCDTTGLPCTPCTPSACLESTCLFDANQQQYRCGDRGSFDGDFCYNDGDCDNYASTEFEECDYVYRSKSSGGGGCGQVCVNSCECPSGQTCRFFHSSTQITPSTPGICF